MLKRLNKNQSGFTAIEGLLIILVVVAICVAGWLVYKDHHKAATSTATTKQENGGKGGTAHPDTGPAKTEVFIIPEWKVSAEIPTPPADAALIQYKVVNDGQQTYANFTTQELLDLDKNECTADNAPAGIIFKAKPSDPLFYNSDGSTSSQTVAQALASGQFTPYKSVGANDYWFTPPPTPCNTTSQGQQLQQQAMTEVKAIVSALSSE